ncbi:MULTISPECIES: hypothetical protein [unclassified Nonomuraea]|uniref:hypothetical protein n=1 Tax=unclassified Nonomuraea TaxID=2593643 RepID=UPI0033D787D1
MPFDDHQRESSRRIDHQREMVRRSTDDSSRRRDRDEWRARRGGGDELSLGTQIILAVVALAVFFLVVYPQLPHH